MTMLRVNPFWALDNLFDGQSSFGKQVFTKGDLGDNQMQATWSPQVDIVEDESKVIIAAELAGVPKEAINVQVEKQILTLSGEKSVTYEDAKNHRSERYFGRFERKFSLPDYVDVENITAESKDGILTLTLPKQTEVQKRQHIEIH